jgi:hypothetical protein
MTAEPSTVTEPVDPAATPKAPGHRRLLAAVIVAVVAVAGLVVGLWFAFSPSDTPRPALVAVFPHRSVLAQGTGDARVRLPHTTGRVIVTLVCRDSHDVSARFRRARHVEFGLTVYCNNGIGTSALASRARWPDAVIVTSSAPDGKWALLAGRSDSIRRR